MSKKLLSKANPKKYLKGEIWLSAKTGEIRKIIKEDYPIPGYRMIVFQFLRKTLSSSDAVTVASFSLWIKNHHATRISSGKG